jgi:HEAT repeat protein
MIAFDQVRDDALVALERAPSPVERAQAVHALCDLAVSHPERSGDLAPVLPQLLGDPSPVVRVEALQLAALSLSADEAMETLSRSLTDGDERVRLEAAGRLADLVLPQARGALAVALEDAEFNIRFEAARGMAALGHSAGRDVLLQALDHPDFRFRAIGSLAELGDPEAIPALKALLNRFFIPAFDRTQAAGALARLGESAGADHLLKRIRRGRWKPDRALALELCGEVKVPGAFEQLAEVVRQPKDACRGAAARGLGRLGDLRALPVLAQLLEENGAHEDLRLDAAEGLWRLGGADARAQLQQALLRWPPGEGRDEVEALMAEAAP